jgi:hypothetical protein
MPLLDDVEAALATLPCQKLNDLVQVLRKINSETPSPEQTKEILKWLDCVSQHLEQAKMTYMAGAPPSTETMEMDKQRWGNLTTLLNKFPIIWIVVNDGKVVNVMFATLDTRDTWSLFHDHFTLTNSPPMSHPQYSKGQWVLYDFQNHVQNPDMLLNYVPVEYAGHKLLVHVEERADWK